jgi:hypothetical protein
MSDATETAGDDYDSPWKEVLDDYFPSFLAFFFPEVYGQVDWSRQYESLDTELQQVVRDAEFGRRRVDKLYRVWRVGGNEALVFIHTEIQNQQDPEFPRRMFIYHYRLYDRFGQEIISLAVLGDENANWRPDRFGYNTCGCRLTFEFPIAKLLDYGVNIEALESNRNPFAVVVLAHLKTKETREDVESRRAWKLRIVRGLYARGLGGDDVRKLFRFIDWLMALPDDLERAFWSDVLRIEEEHKMPFVTIGERIGREKGLEEGLALGRQEGRQEGVQEGLREGLLHGIEFGLESKFGAAGTGLLDEIRSLRAVESLQQVFSALKTAQTFDEVRGLVGSLKSAP